MPEPHEGMDPDRVGRAVALASKLHRSQVRKGTTIPYVSHLLSVAALVVEDLGSEDEVVAALLHDAAEDQGGEEVLVVIERDFGPVVAGLVRECSDAVVGHGERKAPWAERKEEAVRLLVTRSSGALRVIAADKLHNTRSTLADLLIHGETTWDRFKTGRDGFVWYHRRTAEELARLVPGSRSVVLLHQELDRLDPPAVGAC